jgi:hypothetical protein
MVAPAIRISIGRYSEVAIDAPLPGGADGVPEFGQHHHEESSGHSWPGLYFCNYYASFRIMLKYVENPILTTYREKHIF